MERFDIAVPGGNRVGSVRIALPASYTAAKARKRRYPLLVVFDAQMCFGSAVEMSRLMSATEEIHDCIIAGIDTVAADFEHTAGDASWLIAHLPAACGQRYRLRTAQPQLSGSVQKTAG